MDGLIWNGVELSRSVWDGVNLTLHLLTNQKEKIDQSLLLILVNGWINEYFTDWSALSNSWILETKFRNGTPIIRDNSKPLNSTAGIKWL